MIAPAKYLLDDDALEVVVDHGEPADRDRLLGRRNRRAFLQPIFSGVIR
jgi:hypothetical protein